MIKNNEADYYSATKKVFCFFAPFYDAIAVFISKTRNKVVDFSGLEKGSKLLDVCSGTGQQAFAFAKKGYDVTGVDLSEAMLKVANRKNKYANVKFELADAANLAFKSDAFDASCVSFALHDMPLPIREKVLKEMARVTKRQGVVIIVDYALPRNKVAAFLAYHFICLYEVLYYKEFIKSRLAPLLEKTGIKTEKELSVMFGAGKVLKGRVEK